MNDFHLMDRFTKDDKFRNWIGAIFSILISLFTLIYFSLEVNTMVHYGKDIV